MGKSEKTLAIITARGGSKRIPMKNMKQFCGKPIIEYSITAALESEIFDEIMVSTDDKVIADFATKKGAKVPFLRSQENSDDFATTADVVREVIQKYEDQGQNFDRICCIYPTAPFINAEKLKKAQELLEHADAVVPVVKFSYPPQRCLVVDDNYLTMKWPENMSARSQDLEPFYHDVGQF